ncbi:3',5'-cyclic-AMP phosphodiesterase [Vibrio sp. SM6]|uniref:3',5'-cyclic adenosine monophosphate phosphodiesterase CpdA n=1 Tax=Vibrio agarilyticus TaxID=2726741 RepID=A0A7X8YG52_9VIBR|nr:3',5'-cyclic-AMP phosphodiesterase [Vibrio agarilyticus]
MSALESVRLLQITDTHLFAAEEGSLLSVNTLASFTAVVDAIVRQQVGFDAIIATGDISQDHTDSSYQRFAKGIEPLQKPCFWLPGNHDYKPGMHSIFPSAQIHAPTTVMLGQHWQMVLLDSQVAGVPHGYLEQTQLDQLEQALSENRERYTLVLLHHPPRLVGSQWLDQHTLKEAEAFWQLVAQFDHVRGVVCGHVHQELDCVYQGVRVLATPSTCVQFKPNSDDFALDRNAPGWRELTLQPNGVIETQVKRLQPNHFLPDFTSAGY